MRGQEVTQGQEMTGEQALQEHGGQEMQAQQKGEEEEEKEDGEEEDGIQQVATVTAAALSTVAISGMNEEEDQEEEEEKEEEECSVCRNVIESDDSDNLAGPYLACVHRYHAFCLHFWVEKCRSKCIEATCPYCRSPLPEMEGV